MAPSRSGYSGVMETEGAGVSTWVAAKTTTYTPTSKVAFVTDGDGRVTSTTYDGADRVGVVTDPALRQSEMLYDAAGNTLQEIRALGTPLQETYATYTYGGDGEKLTVYDADGASHATTYTYDGFNRLSVTTYPDGSTDNLSYDSNTNILSRNTRAGQTINFTYDVLNRPLTEAIPAVGTIPADTITKAYDLGGRVTELSDTPGDVVLPSYDTAGRTYRVATTIAGLSGARTTTYTLDANSNRTRLTWPDGYYANYTFDTLNRMSVVTDSTSATLATYSYDPYSRRTNLAYGNTASIAYTYSTAGDLLTLSNNLAGTSNDVSYTLGYSNAHEFASETTSLTNYKWQPPAAAATNSYAAANVLNQYPTVTPAGGSAQTLTYDGNGNLTFDGAFTYTYDPENKLMIASNVTTGGTISATYAYDPEGRRQTKTVGYDVLGDIISKTGVGTYTYGAGAPGPHAVTSIVGTVNGVVNPTYTYDANGNMTGGAGRSVTYTSFNMAATVAEGTTNIGFVYGPDHQRAEQCVGGCTSPTATTLYLNGPGNEEKVTSGSSVTWNDYITANGAIVAERFNIAGTVSLLYFTGDHLGSPSVLTNSSGAVVERDSYDAFGKRRNANGTDNTACSITSSTTRGYTEQEMMDSVCEINMNARIYDPTIGRFMSADSMVPNPLNGQSFNRFSYLENNPLNAIDPSGHGDQDSSAPYQYYDGGPPCWGCAGPGEISDQQGNIIPATYGLLANANALTFQWDGNTVTCMTASCVQQTMTQIQGSTTTPTINYEFPQVGITITEQYQTYDAGTAADYTGPGGIETVPVTCGCFQTWTVSGQNGAGFNNGVYYPGQDQGQFIPVVHPIPFVVSQGDIDAAKKNLSAVLRGFSGKPSGPFNGSLSQQQANEIASEIVDNLSLTQAQTLQGIAPQNPLTIDQAQLNIIQSQIGQLTPDVVGVAQAALQSALQSGAVRVNR